MGIKGVGTATITMLDGTELKFENVEMSVDMGSVEGDKTVIVCHDPVRAGKNRGRIYIGCHGQGSCTVDLEAVKLLLRNFGVEVCEAVRMVDNLVRPSMEEAAKSMMAMMEEMQGMYKDFFPTYYDNPEPWKKVLGCMQRMDARR